MSKIKRAFPVVMVLALAACVEATGPTSGNETALLGIERLEQQQQQDGAHRPGQGIIKDGRDLE